MKNSEIAKVFGKSDSFISLIKSCERDFSWEMSAKMSELFPEKTMAGWRESSFEEWNKTLTEGAE